MIHVQGYVQDYNVVHLNVLNVSSTTEPVRRRTGSVVELTFNKRAIQGLIPGSEQFHPGEHRMT
jgi:hypothetical protein